MHSAEWQEFVECTVCGATVAPATDRAFQVAEEAFVCFGCALERGGVYDEDEDRWVVVPDLSEATASLG